MLITPKNEALYEHTLRFPNKRKNNYRHISLTGTKNVLELIDIYLQINKTCFIFLKLFTNFFYLQITTI